MRKMLKSIKEIDFKKYLKVLVIIGIVGILSIGIDQATKYIAEAFLKPGETVPFIPHFIDWYLTYNTGAAWGFLGDEIWGRVILVCISWIVAIFIPCYLISSMTKKKEISVFLSVIIGLIAGGNVGNLIDRTFFFNRGVIDFISIQSWWKGFGIFNIADSCLVVGLFLLIIYLIIDLVKDQKAQKIENEKLIQKQKEEKLLKEKENENLHCNGENN